MSLHASLDKPRYSHPCNHCGLCCRMSLCEIGALAFPDAVAPCPALTVLDGKSLCGLVLIEKSNFAEPVISNTLGIGCGCSMADEDTTEAEMNAFDLHSREKVFGPGKSPDWD